MPPHIKKNIAGFWKTCFESEDRRDIRKTTYYGEQEKPDEITKSSLKDSIGSARRMFLVSDLS